MNKRGEFLTNVDLWKPKVIRVTKSWCDHSVLDGEIAIEGYVLYRQDKIAPLPIGGVLLYIHESLQATPCQHLNDLGFESSLWCEVKVNDDYQLLVGVCYRSLLQHR